MYIRIRLVNFKTKEPDFILNVTKNTYISDIMSKINKRWECSEFQQRLLYKGKQLASNCRVFEYNIQLNDVIQLLIRDLGEVDTVSNHDLVDVDSKFYDEGEAIDFRCETYFSWWRGIIVGIKKHKYTKFTTDMSLEEMEKHFYFIVRFDYPDIYVQEYITTFDSIRPRSTTTYSFDKLNKHDIINIKYNLGSSYGDERWYDMIILNLNAEEKIIEGTLYLGPIKSPVPHIMIPYVDNEIFKVEKFPTLDDNGNRTDPQPFIMYTQACKSCKVYNNDCNKCGCYICAGKNDPGSIILCDECDKGYHYFCLKPPLPFVPTESEWYCPNCINVSNIIEKGQTPIQTKRMANRPALSEGAEGKVWGRGMACVGRTKSCTIVPLNHFGPIPGVEVGMRWMFRIQVSEAGVHRPPVAGIHGRDTEGAYSLIMSGGYEDDYDNGNEFIYTGSGGRDLSGNKKRTADQSKDQELIRNNKALAMNCYAEFNADEGAESKDWKLGKPVRVCRSYKLAKYSKYAPKEGIRYDGIYKVVKYYKEIGKSGYNVWKYLLSRDDLAVPPWMRGAQQFDVICPEGYWEAKQAASSNAAVKSSTATPTKTVVESTTATSSTKVSKFTTSSVTKKIAKTRIASPSKKASKSASSTKRSAESTTVTLAKRAAKSTKAIQKNGGKSFAGDNSRLRVRLKRQKKAEDQEPGLVLNEKSTFRLDPGMIELIESDKLNARIWNECAESIGLGKYFYNLKLQEAFTCIVCKEVVFNPVTTNCNHNTCLGCLKRSFSMKIYECPYCRYTLGKNYKLEINQKLSKILNTLLPGYSQNR